MSTKKTGKKLPKKKATEEPEAATAIHLRNESGDVHAVGIGNLRVMLVHEDGSWFAHGLEIDCFAQGESIEDVQGRFERGLCATLHEHLRINGSIEGILVPAPPEVWQEFLSTKAEQRAYSQFSFHGLPETALPEFSGIQYFQAPAEYA